MAIGRSLFAASLLAAALGCGRETVPLELIGRWTTDDPRYANRSLEIDAERIVFGVDAGLRVTYRLDGVEREPDASAGVTYRLVYGASGEPERELRVRVPTTGHLRIDNHDRLWTRSASGAGS